MKYLRLNKGERRILIQSGEAVTIKIADNILNARMEDAYATTNSLDLGELGGELAPGTYVLLKIEDDAVLSIELSTSHKLKGSDGK